MNALVISSALLILVTALLREASSGQGVAYEVIAEICEGMFGDCLFDCEVDYGRNESPELLGCFHNCSNEMFDCKILMWHFK